MISELQEGEIPHCHDCGHVLKPNAILLGEQLPVKTFHAAEQNAQLADAARGGRFFKLCLWRVYLCAVRKMEHN